VIEAHRCGILTSASLMVTGDAVGEAVALAKQNPSLGVGLHVALADARAAGAPAELGSLVDSHGQLVSSPVRAGFRYFFDRTLRPALRVEIAAQFALFRETGLPLDHVNGHQNIHLHPVVFGILMEQRSSWTGAGFRLTRDPFWLNAGLASGRWAYRASHAMIFSLLSRLARRRLMEAGIPVTAAVFGLLQYPSVDEHYLLRLLARLPEGDSEIYSHPSLEQFRHEYAALISPRVMSLLSERGIQRIRYSDLSAS
jgi:hopanoid biosynthesis associated protein HpnK